MSSAPPPLPHFPFLFQQGPSQLLPRQSEQGGVSSQYKSESVWFDLQVQPPYHSSLGPPTPPHLRAGCSNVVQCGIPAPLNTSFGTAKLLRRCKMGIVIGCPHSNGRVFHSGSGGRGFPYAACSSFPLQVFFLLRRCEEGGSHSVPLPVAAILGCCHSPPRNSKGAYSQPRSGASAV